ncbi:MAG: glycerol-3-phosphate acyltransferase, partial [Bacteroidales bacterium]
MIDLNIVSIIVIAFFSYLLGSVSFAIVIGKYFYGKDVRLHGSKNPGATNVFRVLGKTAGIIVLLLDMLKGFLASISVYLFFDIEAGTNQFINLQILFGLCAVLGHLFPVFFKFKGGKGVATLTGMVLAIA